MAISLFFANKRTRADPAEHRAHAALGPSQTPARAGVGAYIIRPDENELLSPGTGRGAGEQRVALRHEIRHSGRSLTIFRYDARP